ncbi:MAG: universal stress protein [Deltaproteobacteria bacterium]|nr:universal stress protein [Deltaproteobacteria bacterium]MBW2360570.1 universal stress protein [Deltaproteobacteria bacterium]
MKFDCILVPTDFSDDASRALETAIQLAKLQSGRIVLLHAYPIDLPITYPGFSGGALVPDEFYRELRTQADAHVAQAAQEAARSGVSVTGKAVTSPASAAIIAEAEHLPADLIVMGTRGRTGLKHILLGSVAERVVREAPCPVLTVKAEH